MEIFMGSRRNELNTRLNARLVKIYDNHIIDFTDRWFNFIDSLYYLVCANCNI